MAYCAKGCVSCCGGCCFPRPCSSATFTSSAAVPGIRQPQRFTGWTSQAQLAQQTAANTSRLDATFQRLGGYSIEQLAGDHQALAMGEVLFRDNCAACHGRNAKGNQLLGAPNLADHDWLYGGDGQAIQTSILDGRRGVMPAWGTQFGDAGVENLANYVLTLAAHPMRRPRPSPARRCSRSAQAVMGRKARAIPHSARQISPTLSGSTAATWKRWKPASAMAAAGSCRRGARAWAKTMRA